MLKFASLFAVLGLCACTTNQLIVVAPQPVTTAAQAAAKQCFSPDDQQAHYVALRPIVRAGVVVPPQAKSSHVNGCAAVRFQLTADGKPVNISVLREFPAGYGYGDAVADQVRRSTYPAPATADGWYFENSGVSVGG